MGGQATIKRLSVHAQSLQRCDQPRGHHRPVSDGQPLCRQLAADARIIIAFGTGMCRLLVERETLRSAI
jgi:hypothetical protein